MGLVEVGYLVISFVVAAIVVGIAYGVLRVMKFDMSRLPRKWMPHIVTFAVMVVSVSTLVALTGISAPAHRGADIAAMSRIEEGSLASQVVRVYEFESSDDIAKESNLGPALSQRVIDFLRERDLKAWKGAEEDLPLDLHRDSDDGRRGDSGLIEHYSRLAPFVCVSGRMEQNNDGRFEVTLTVSRIDVGARSSTLRVLKAKLTESPAEIERVAKQLADETWNTLR